MREVWEVASAILLSIGGGGALVLGLSSWLGKVWANRILQNEKSQHQIEIENFKNELQKELEWLKGNQEKALYVTKLQYDNEYRIYQELWEVMHVCIKRAKLLCTISNVESDLDPSYRRKQFLSRYGSFQIALESYDELIDKYSPFYTNEFYNKFLEIQKKCKKLAYVNLQLGKRLRSKESSDQKSNTMSGMDLEELIMITLPNEIDEIRNELQSEIRNYLMSLQFQ